MASGCLGRRGGGSVGTSSWQDCENCGGGGGGWRGEDGSGGVGTGVAGGSRGGGSVDRASGGDGGGDGRMMGGRKHWRLDVGRTDLKKPEIDITGLR